MRPPINPDAFVGDVVERFRLEEPFHGSDIGFLYRARDIHQTAEQGERLAIRFFRPDSADDDTLEHLARYAELTHDCIIGYGDVGRVSHGPFEGSIFTTRTATITSLRQLLRGPDRIEPVAAWNGLIDMLSGVQALHSHGLLHGDIRPSNVLCSRQGRWALVDFGLLENCSSLVTTPRSEYRAPETYDGEFITASDVYSVVITFAESLGAFAPLDTAFQRSFIQDLGMVADVPSGMDELLLAAVAADPATRPSAAHLLSYVRGTDRADEAVLATFADPAMVSRLRAALLRGMPYLGSEYASDIVNESILRTLERVRKDPALAVRLSAREATFRYALTAARNVARGRFRARRPHVDIDVVVDAAAQLATASPYDDPAVLVEIIDSAVTQLEHTLGRSAARIARMRSYGFDFSRIASLASSREDPWTEDRVFMVLYRLRRAYPELVHVFPPDSLPDARARLERWLETIGIDSSLDRALLSAQLSGESLRSAAQRLHMPAGTARARLSRLRSRDPVVSALVDPRLSLPAGAEDVLALARSTAVPARLRELDEPWLDSIRDRAQRLLEHSIGDDPDARSLLPRGVEAAVDAILVDIEVAIGARSRILSFPMMTVGDVARALDIGDIDAKSVINSLWEAGELVVLSDGQVPRIPAFQVSGNAIHPLVRELNRRLGAKADPWGVASWWFDSNGWINGGGAPHELIDDPTYVDVLLTLATAEETM